MVGLVNEVYTDKRDHDRTRRHSQSWREDVRYVKQPVSYDSGCSSYRSPRRSHHNRQYRAPARSRYHTKTVYQSRRTNDLVIVNLEDGRRICQRRIRGASAYLQIWSDVDEEWVSIREYPSIW